MVANDKLKRTCSAHGHDECENYQNHHQKPVVLACSKRSDSGERCEVKKAMKSRGGLAFIFSRSFLLRTAPHYLNAWNRLLLCERGKQAKSRTVS